MKQSEKMLAVLLLALLLCVAGASTALAADTVIMTIDSPTMTVDGAAAEIDPGIGTTPVILNNRTVLPVRAVIEALGGEVSWDADSQTATLRYDGQEVRLVIDSTTAYRNQQAAELDVAPVILQGRTMLPIRFIAESFGFDVAWDPAAQTVTVSKTAAEKPAANPDPQVGVFDLENATVLLNNGMEMPILGIGTFTLTNEQAADSVYWALSDGYHLIDTASAYGNEVGVGQGIQRAIDDGLVTREDIFVTTKLWPNNYNMEGIDAALERLGLDYIDLLLLHQPLGDYIGGYQAMEQAVAEGKVRAIGLSNFRPEQFAEVAEVATILPAINQVETHPYYQETEMMAFLPQYGTVLEAWYPLGGRGNTATMFADETISAIAAAHGKSSAQIILRWHLQAGHIAIPGSNNPDHILENISIFDFALSDEEMAAITAIDKNDPFFGGFGGQDEMEEAADRWNLNV